MSDTDITKWLPPLPEEFDHWELRGHGFETDCSEFPGMVAMLVGDIGSDDAWCAYYEAVKYNTMETYDKSNTRALGQIAMMVTPHLPKGFDSCETVDAVAWLIERHKAGIDARSHLEQIKTDEMAERGMSYSASAVSAARVALMNSEKARETVIITLADEKLQRRIDIAP